MENQPESNSKKSLCAVVGRAIEAKIYAGFC